MKNQVSYLRKINIGLCLVFFLTGLIMEVVFFLIRFGAEELAQPVGNYLIWHLILPSGINLVLFLAAILLMKRYETDSRSLNYIPVVTLVLQVAVLGTFHYSYSLLMTLFLFPIFLETVYGDRDLCQTAILLSFLCETILLLVRWYLTMRGGNDDPAFLPEAVLVYAILAVGGALAVRMVDRFLDLRDAEAKERERETAMNMNMQMVTALVNTIEAKDPYTNGQSCCDVRAGDRGECREE